MNFADVVKECESIAQMILEDTHGPEIDDAIWEAIDNHQWIIYTGKSWDVVNAARLAGGHWLDDADAEVINNQGPMFEIDGYITALAFFIMFQTTRDAVTDITRGADL